jgi:hypothetical protein
MMHVDRAIRSLIRRALEGEWNVKEFLCTRYSHGGFFIKKRRVCHDPMRSVEHLNGFQNHLYNVFISVSVCRFAWI